MIKKYNNISLAWGVPGLVIQTAGILCDQPLVMWLGSLLFLVGLAYYAKAKRQHPAWCLMAFLSIIGILVLGCLKDRGAAPPKLPTGQDKNDNDTDGLSTTDAELTERFILPVGRSGWAIASGYLGLFSVLIIPAPFALLTGVLAIRAMRRDPKKHGMGRAVFGIVMGGLGTAILLLAVAGAPGCRHRPPMDLKQHTSSKVVELP